MREIPEICKICSKKYNIERGAEQCYQFTRLLAVVFAGLTSLLNAAACLDAYSSLSADGFEFHAHPRRPLHQSMPRLQPWNLTTALL